MVACPHSVSTTLIQQSPPLDDRRDPKTGLDGFNIEAFWKAAAPKIPKTALALRGVLTNALTSCPSERVFSIMKNSFGPDQDLALEDYVELRVMLQFNERGRDTSA